MRIHHSIVGGLHRCIISEIDYFLPLLHTNEIAENVTQRARAMFDLNTTSLIENETADGSYVPCLEIMGQIAYVLVQPQDLLPVGYEIHKSHSIDVFNQIGDLVYQCHPSTTLSHDDDGISRFHTLRSRREVIQNSQHALQHMAKYRRIRALESIRA